MYKEVEGISQWVDKRTASAVISDLLQRALLAAERRVCCNERILLTTQITQYL